MKSPPEWEGACVLHAPDSHKIQLPQSNLDQRALQLQQVATRTLLEIRATLGEILAQLRHGNSTRARNLKP
jgi:hypothetical protein